MAHLLPRHETDAASLLPKARQAIDSWPWVGTKQVLLPTVENFGSSVFQPARGQWTGIVESPPPRRYLRRFFTSKSSVFYTYLYPGSGPSRPPPLPPHGYALFARMSTMPCFRAAATRSEARKTKGDWIVPAHLAVQTAPPKKSGKRVGFLDLPGELRNQIYGLYFSRGFRVEITSKRRIEVVERPKFILVNPFLSNRKRAKIIDKQPGPLTLRISRPLFKNKAPVKPARWATSFSGLFLVCRQLYLETIKYHYAKTAFSFETMSSFGGFLTRVDELNMAAIMSLELHHHSYGEPHHTKDVVWKQKYDARWQSLCRRAAHQFQGLCSLKINLYVVETPLYFELHAPWVQPLLEFQNFDRVQQNRRTTEGIDIQVRITTRCEKLGCSAAADIHPDLIHAYENLRDLFQEAITHAMHGWNHEDAMFKYRDTFRSQHLRWIHHLNLNEPGSILGSGD